MRVKCIFQGISGGKNEKYGVKIGENTIYFFSLE